MTSTTRATEEEDVVEDVIEDDDDDVLAAIDRRATTTATATTTSSNSARRRAPRDASECATPAKKMAALRAWLDGRGASRALCASGPPGCGKATAIKCVAEEAGYEVREWQAPTPTLWREYSHAKVDGDLGVEYSSKVDDFVAYVERATKYAPLSFLSSKTSRAGGNGFGGERVVLMIRDFPTSDENGRARILEALRRLSTTPNAPPCAVVLTEDEDGGGGGNARSSGRGEIFARGRAPGDGTRGSDVHKFQSRHDGGVDKSADARLRVGGLRRSRVANRRHSAGVARRHAKRSLRVGFLVSGAAKGASIHRDEKGESAEA